MILNTGQRTDIPAFYSEWFLNRIKEGYVLVHNPFHPTQVSRFRLDPALIDCICFCTKNPAPMLPYLSELSAFETLWHVTITPYGKEIEPNVPGVREVLASFRMLSEQVGRERVFWRYDPIFLNETYTDGLHIEKFAEMAKALAGYTGHCIISFIDLYEKTKRNFKGIKTVPFDIQKSLAKEFVSIGNQYGMKILGCCESPALAEVGVDTNGCLTKEVLERALGTSLDLPASEGKARPECACLLGHDIGAYNSCVHGCKYCYANYDTGVVSENMRRHDPASPLLIGHLTKDDIVTDAKQKRYSYGQLRIEDFLN